ncbi:50S ribosomal protein L19 [Zavarzinella formosa]|uniref:50S ribosomal protein L19 n=1 Tax=Zavarzinella formosa TaxID=360055 RepID=UPI0002E4434A|nr:50S ribosomal protein L19 [Zavarzinella formosa]
MKNKLLTIVEAKQSAQKADLNKKQGEISKTSTERTIPQIRVGDTVDVHFWLELGEKGRIQVFSGTVIAIKHEKPDEMINVRKIVQGEGVERIFPLLSPRIAKIEVKKTGAVRRAKLYYLRDRVGKATRLKERKKGPAQTKAPVKK